MKSTIVRRNAWEINTSFFCHNQWFDTVSTNLGTSLGFDHNNEKNVRFPTLATFILWKIILLEGDVA